MDGDRSSAGNGYLFRGRKYLRFNWNSGGGEPFGDGPAAPIQDNWKGLLELLMAGKAKAEAMTWIQLTLQQFNRYSASLSSGAVFADQALMEAALSAHFHVDPSQPTAERVSIIAQVTAGYHNIENTLNLSASMFRFRTDAEAVLDGNPSIDAAFTFFNSTINFTRNFANNGPHIRAAIVIHESVHRFDSQSGDPNTHISEWYVTDATAIALGLPIQADRVDFAKRYDLMNTSNSLHNPSAFAALAQHIFNRSDTRFGAARSNL